MIAKLNEIVTYNGNINNIGGEIRRLLNNFFTIGRQYIVREILNRNGKTYYRFRGFHCKYPMECFV